MCCAATSPLHCASKGYGGASPTVFGPRTLVRTWGTRTEFFSRIELFFRTELFSRKDSPGLDGSPRLSVTGITGGMFRPLRQFLSMDPELLNYLGSCSDGARVIRIQSETLSEVIAEQLRTYHLVGCTKSILHPRSHRRDDVVKRKL